MSLTDKFENLGGKAKEAAGDAVGNDDLRAEGKADQAKAKVKDAIDDVKDAATDVFDKVKNIVKK